MTVDSVGENLLRVKKTIEPYTPNIIAVTKYYGLEAITDAYGAGLRDFGESRANDAIQKIEISLRSKMIHELRICRMRFVKTPNFISSVICKQTKLTEL